MVFAALRMHVRLTQSPCARVGVWLRKQYILAANVSILSNINFEIKPYLYDTVEVNGDPSTLTTCRLVNYGRELYLFLVYFEQCSVNCTVDLVSTNRPKSG